ncbi:hypothetical protein DL98DRAFT_188599 [Cadophora sp. DSE1049]|nr:hypothetical protein DL98DRAFT_188599 [Cadophora sp. DSE1049]
MATTRGTRTGELIAVFDPSDGAATDPKIVTAAIQRAKEAAAAIERSPTAPRQSRKTQSDTERPTVPARPSKQRYRKDSEPTLPASPQEGFYRHRGRGVGTGIGASHSHRPLTPETFGDISVDNLRAELGAVKTEIVSLNERLSQRNDDIQALGRRLNELKERYDEAILDLQRSQVEKDELRDQVERLRSELREERSARREMENELEEKQGRVRELNEMLVRVSEEAAERARRSVLDAEAELARITVRSVETVGENVREKKRTSKRHVHVLIEETPQSSVGSIFPFSKSSKSFKGWRERSGSSKPRWIV